MLARIRRLLNSLIGRFVFSEVLVALVVLTVVAVALTAGARPIQRELIYRRLNDNLVAVVLFSRNFQRRAMELPRPTPPRTDPSRTNPVGQQPAPPARSPTQPPIPERLLRLIEEQAQAQHLRAVIIQGSNHEVLLDTGEDPTGLTEARWRPVTRTPRTPAKALGDSVTWGVVRIRDERWLYAGATVTFPRVDSEVRIALLASDPSTLAALTEMVDALPLPALLLVGLLLGVVILGLSLWLAKSLTAGLQRVVAGTQELAAGNMDYRVPVDEGMPAEVVSLAQSFNQMADQVQRTRQAQRDFVANVSHDLRTPLTSIHGFAQALLDGTASDPEAQERAVTIIHNEAGRLKNLVNELLELARLDSGRLQLHARPVDLSELLTWLLDSYQQRFHQAQISLVRQLNARPLTVSGDPDRLNRIFANLLDNALKYTPQGGTVTVSLAPIQEGGTAWAEVAVTDTGPGIPREETAKLFERFYRLDKSRRRDHGSGLGLAIVKELVVAHGGQVGVESVAGLGSRFWVRFPLLQGLEPSAENVSSESASPPEA